MVLLPSQLRVSRNLRRSLGRTSVEVRFDTAFEAVVRACAETPRAGQSGTWITPEMIEAYCRLHSQGYAHSAEAWQGKELVGGLYGVSLGAAFFGESMFAWRDDASKIAFVQLVHRLSDWNFQLIDCQIYTEHLARFGAVLWPRTRFLAALEIALESPTRRGSWSCLG
jgi:leucyl/phenylalanyl-tRNA--protein transferase